MEEELELLKVHGPVLSKANTEKQESTIGNRSGCIYVALIKSCQINKVKYSNCCFSIKSMAGGFCMFYQLLIGNNRSLWKKK